jgi:hypothetical protein
MTSLKPILVTGAPRSGTSWVGRMISQVPFVRYVHEPFNISSRPCRCGTKFDYWFYYLSSSNRMFFHNHLNHIFFPAFSKIGLFNLISEMVESKRVGPLMRYFQSYLFHRVVVKDPIAVFSAEKLADMYDMNVVVLIRHPAAIVNSYKVLNWTHPFSHFLYQSELMKKHLAPFRPEIEDFVENQHDIIDQVALLWKLIHYMIIKYAEMRPGWLFVRYEDLALNPIEGYQNMFDWLGLPFSEHTRNAIQAHSLREQKTNTADPYAIKQNPSLVVSQWKKALTSSEIERIRRRVEDVASSFYSDEEWKC